jgi:hypothetical protein
MDSSIIAAVSAILGSTVGGVTTFATTFVNQRYVARREMLVKDVANREELYAEFLKEVADLYRESIDRTLDDLATQPYLGELQAHDTRQRDFVRTENVIEEGEPQL